MAAMGLFTGLNLLQRKVAVNTDNPRALSVLFSSMGAVFAFIIFIVSGSAQNFSLPTQPQAWLVLAMAALGYGLYERYRFTAAKLLDASTFSLIINISVLIAFIGSMLVYQEAVTLPKIIGGCLIIGSLFLATYQKQRQAVSRSGVLIACGISVALGLAWIMDKQGVLYFNPDVYGFLNWVIPILIIGTFPLVKLQAIKQEIRHAYKQVALISIINVVGFWCNLKALELAEATQVIPIIQSSTLFTVLLGILILKERHYVVRKIIAGILTVVGIYLVV